MLLDDDNMDDTEVTDLEDDDDLETDYDDVLDSEDSLDGDCLLYTSSYQWSKTDL